MSSSSSNNSTANHATSTLDLKLDLESLHNLDPTVVALLQADTANVTPQQLRVRIAMMKMQQSRIRGNSDYAAKIMEHAIDEGAKDKQAWELLDTAIGKIEAHIQKTNTNANDTAQMEAEKETQNSKEEAENNNEGRKDDDGDGSNNNNDSSNNNMTSAEVEALKAKVAELEASNTSSQHLFEQRLLEELEAIQKDQENLQELEANLQKRIQSVQSALQQLPTDDNSATSTTRKELNNKLREVHQDVSLPHVDCTICHTSSATHAIIPCGHFCLCETCKDQVAQQVDVQQRCCPLCRGHLLSTLKIFISK